MLLCGFFSQKSTTESLAVNRKPSPNRVIALGYPHDIMRLKQAQRAAAVTWGPTPQTSSLLASGTVAGSIDGSFSCTGTQEPSIQETTRDIFRYQSQRPLKFMKFMTDGDNRISRLIPQSVSRDSRRDMTSIPSVVIVWR